MTSYAGRLLQWCQPDWPTCNSVSFCVHKYKGNWATNKMLIRAGFCQQLLPHVVDTVRRQNGFAGLSMRLIWGVRKDLCLGGLLQHACNVNEWVAVSTVAPVQQLSLVPALPIPISKLWMRFKCFHDAGTAILRVSIGRTSASGNHLQVWRVVHIKN